MKGQLLSIFIIAFSLNSKAQSGAIMQSLDPNYQNYALLYNKVDLRNSPFLMDAFCKAELVMENGTSFNDLELKLDIIEQRIVIHYNGADGVLNSSNVKEFKILSTETSKNKEMLFQKVETNGKIAFFQVLFYNDDLKFYKKIKKSIKNNTEVESTGYHSDSGNKALYTTSESYFLHKSGQLFPVKLSKKDILDNLSVEYTKCCQLNNCKLNKESGVVDLLKNCKI